jgi:L-threonylcarbamoyladenylate synthase
LTKQGPSIRVVRSLVPILREGGAVLLPTDTIYGFSARFDSLDARRRIRELKGSESASPMLSLVSGPEMVFRYAEAPHGASYDLLLKHWPGPLTAVLRARPHVRTEFCGPGDTLSFRWPVSPFLQALLGALGAPLFSTSANRAGEPTAHRFEPLSSAFGASLDALVDGGELNGQASTIVDLTGSDPIVLRSGALNL